MRLEERAAARALMHNELDAERKENARLRRELQRMRMLVGDYDARELERAARLLRSLRTDGRVRSTVYHLEGQMNRVRLAVGELVALADTLGEPEPAAESEGTAP